MPRGSTTRSVVMPSAVRSHADAMISKFIERINVDDVNLMSSDGYTIQTFFGTGVFTKTAGAKSRHSVFPKCVNRLIDHVVSATDLKEAQTINLTLVPSGEAQTVSSAPANTLSRYVVVIPFNNESGVDASKKSAPGADSIVAAIAAGDKITAVQPERRNLEVVSVQPVNLPSGLMAGSDEIVNSMAKTLLLSSGKEGIKISNIGAVALNVNIDGSKSYEFPPTRGRRVTEIRKAPSKRIVLAIDIVGKEGSSMDGIMAMASAAGIDLESISKKLSDAGLEKEE